MTKPIPPELRGAHAVLRYLYSAIHIGIDSANKRDFTSKNAPRSSPYSAPTAMAWARHATISKNASPPCAREINKPRRRAQNLASRVTLHSAKRGTRHDEDARSPAP